MANKYRLMDTDGKPRLKAVYGGQGMAGADLIPIAKLNGLSPQQHCESLGGRFDSRDPERSDYCWMKKGGYRPGSFEVAAYEYQYFVCTELEMTGTLNSKATNIHELQELTGDERIILKNEPIGYMGSRK